MGSNMTRVAYRCNGKNPKCCGSMSCIVNNIDYNPFGCICEHTMKEEYAVNGPCEDPWNHPERFRRIRIGEDGTVFEEI